MGYNYRLSDINCALGVVQLQRFEELKSKRRQVFEMYREQLADESRLVIPQDPPDCEVNWFVYVVRLQDEFTQAQRDQVLEMLREEGIGCSNYFTPIHLQPFIQEMLGYKQGDFPITERIAERTIALPFCNNLTEKEIETVCETLKQSLDGIKN